MKTLMNGDDIQTYKYTTQWNWICFTHDARSTQTAAFGHQANVISYVYNGYRFIKFHKDR